jgi:hypothetical protein
MHKVRYVSRKAHHAVPRESGFLRSLAGPPDFRAIRAARTGTSGLCCRRGRTDEAKMPPGLWLAQTLSPQILRNSWNDLVATSDSLVAWVCEMISRV